MRIKFNKEDKLHINKKWVRNITFTVGLILSLLSLVEIFYILFKPIGYEKIVAALGENYILRLIIGGIFLFTWYLLQKSKQKE